jgi:hypothetical protein
MHRYATIRLGVSESVFKQVYLVGSIFNSEATIPGSNQVGCKFLDVKGRYNFWDH